MSDNDKQDMINGDLPINALEAHIKIWMENNMPDFVQSNPQNSGN